MEAIAKGILSGLGYGLLLGPLFFLNIRVTLSQGLQHGIALVAGAFTSDFCLVLASWWGAEQLSAVTGSAIVQAWFGLLCGLLLLGFGIAAAWPRKLDINKQMSGKLPVSRRRYAYLQGLLVNFTNPSNWLFWISVATVAKSQATANEEQFSRLFMGAALATLFLTDLSKVALADQIGKRLKPGLPEKIIKIAGVILIALSIWILYSVASTWPHHL